MGIEAVDLRYVFGLAPEQAIEHFKSKGYVISWDWHEVLADAHNKAFTVAKVIRLDILQDIRDALTKALETGQAYSEFEKELVPILQRKGWWGRQEKIDIETGEVEKFVAGSPWRLQNIFANNLQTSYMAGRYKAFMGNVDHRPFWQYVAVMDNRTRPTHAAMNGLTFRYDDPFWNSFYPPNGFRCRCRVRALSGGNMEESDIALSDSSGRMGEKKVLLSKKTGELTEVATYRSPFDSKLISPDAGWSYNPGKTDWKPDLGKYDPDIAALGKP